MIKDLPSLHQFIGLSLMCIVMIFYLIDRFSFAVGLMVGCLLFSSLWRFCGPYESNLGILSYPVASAAGRSFIAVIMPIVTALMLANYTKNLFAVLEVIAVIDSILVLKYHYGFFNVHSMDSTFMALMYPSICFRPHIWMGFSKKASAYYLCAVTLPVIAILYAKGATGIGLLASTLFVYTLFEFKEFITRRHWMSLGFMFSAFAIYAYGAFNHLMTLEFFRDGERFRVWEMSMQFWSKYANHYYGFGIGSFEWFSPMLLNRKYDLFLVMHNEYLQTLFEMGTIGLSAMLVLFIYLFKITFDRPWLFVTMLGFALASMLQFPFHCFLTQFLAVLVVMEAHNGPKTT